MEQGSAGANRLINRLLIAGALISLVLGLGFYAAGRDFAPLIWTAGTLPVVVALALAILRVLMAGRAGLDAIAFLSMRVARRARSHRADRPCTAHGASAHG
jgi:hypothetical protein